MKNDLKVKAIASMLIMLIILAVANISKAYSVEGGLTSTGKLKAGEQVKVTLQLSKIDALDGLRAVSADEIVYDKDIFETISVRNFTGSEGWAASYTGKLVLDNKWDPMVEAGSVVTLTLKVKEGITAESTEVEFKNVKASSGTEVTGGTGLISLGDKKITIDADKDASSGTDDSKTNSLAPTNETPATKNEVKGNVAPNSTTNKITSSKTTSSKLPKAGDAATIAIMAIIALALIAGVVGYIKYSKNKDIK